MFKRICSLLVVFVMVLGMTVYVSAADKATENENAVKLLENLSILFEKNEQEYESAVSRADFAVYAARALGIDDSVSDSETRYYIDMASYDYASYSVNTLVERGILSVGEDRFFRPGDMITFEEAVKIAVCMIGYKPAAEARGGYPAGYLRIATQLDLISVSYDNLFSLNDAAVLLTETLIAPQYMVNSVTIEESGNTYGYYESEENTLMYEVFGYRCTEGILTGYDEINIRFDVTAAENRAVVENTAYEVADGLDLTDFLGANICILYDDNDVIHYVYAKPSGEKITEVDVGDYVGYDGNTFKFSEGDKGNKTINVAEAVVIYNGAAPETGIPELFKNLESGTIRLVNCDGKGAVDAIVVNDYHAFVYKSMDSTKNILFSKLDGQSAIELDSYVRSEITDLNGNSLLPIEIEENSVLNVLAATDKSRIKIIVSKEKASGTVTEINGGSNARIKVGSVDYPVNKRYMSILDEIKAGQTVTLLLNMYGEVVMLADGVYDSMRVGCLTGLTLGGGVFDTGLQFRIFSESDGLAVYPSADGIRIDGIRYDSAKDAANNIPDTSCSGSSVVFKSQIILYRLNSDNEITHIDTWRVSKEESPDLTLSRVNDGTTSIQKYSGRFGKNLPVNSETDVFCIPPEENLSSNAADYTVVRESRFNNTVSFKLECYKTRGDNEFVDAVLYHVNPTDTELNDWLNSNMFMVGEISDSIDKNGELFKNVSGLMQGAAKTLEVYENELIAGSDSVSSLSEGDLIRYRTAQNGRVIQIQKIYDESEEKRIGWASDTDELSLYDTGFASNFNISFGYVNKRGNKVVSWGYKSGSAADEAVDLSSLKIMFYDRNMREGQRLYTGTIDSVIDYESAGDKCDIIMLQTSQTYLRSAVVYKR